MPLPENAPTTEPEVTIVAPIVAPVGGMERALYELARQLLGNGFHVTVIALSTTIEDQPGFRFVRVPGPNRPATVAAPWFFVAASLLTWRNRRGLVHSQGAHIANRADVITVQFCHRAFRALADFPRRQRDTWIYALNEKLGAIISRSIEAWAYRPERVRRVVTVAHGVERELQQFFPSLTDRIQVIPNGVDLDSFSPEHPEASDFRAEHGLPEGRTAIFVGGDWERKGLRYVIEGVAGAEGWHLVVAGAGERSRFEQLADQVGASGRVHFVGKLADPGKAFAAADAFVFPSAYEAFPLVVLEAAASGLPLIVTKGNGTEELVVEGENGYFVGRDGDEIASRLRDITPDAARQMGAAARTSVGDYGWDRIGREYIEVYRSLASVNGG